MITVKKNFYRLICILSKTGNECADIVLSLCQSYCVPILLYGVGATILTASEKLGLASPFDRLFSKLFSTFDSNSIAYCQYYTGHLPLQYIIDFFVCRLSKCYI